VPVGRDQCHPSLAGRGVRPNDRRAIARRWRALVCDISATAHHYCVSRGRLVERAIGERPSILRWGLWGPQAAGQAAATQALTDRRRHCLSRLGRHRRLSDEPIEAAEGEEES
jgi:hypothetical protein